jgi:hypothetical protein
MRSLLKQVTPSPTSNSQSGAAPSPAIPCGRLTRVFEARGIPWRKPAPAGHLPVYQRGDFRVKHAARDTRRATGHLGLSDKNPARH